MAGVVLVCVRIPSWIGFAKSWLEFDNLITANFHRQKYQTVDNNKTVSKKYPPNLDKFRMMAGAVAICVRIPAWIRPVLIGIW